LPALSKHALLLHARCGPSLAGPGAVLVRGTVTDLVVGSGRVEESTKDEVACQGTRARDPDLELGLEAGRLEPLGVGA
jgi:hypothetical protein